MACALALWLVVATMVAQTKGHRISIHITDKATHEAIVMATVQLQPAGAMTVR